MDHKELINRLRYNRVCPDDIADAATVIETLLAERDAAVGDLTRICEDNPDVCEYCKHMKHMPCTDSHGRCIGWQWRGPQKGDGHGG